MCANARISCASDNKSFGYDTFNFTPRTANVVDPILRYLGELKGCVCRKLNGENLLKAID